MYRTCLIQTHFRTVKRVLKRKIFLIKWKNSNIKSHWWILNTEKPEKASICLRLHHFWSWSREIMVAIEGELHAGLLEHILTVEWFSSRSSFSFVFIFICFLRSKIWRLFFGLIAPLLCRMRVVVFVADASVTRVVCSISKKLAAMSAALSKILFQYTLLLFSLNWLASVAD